MKKRVLKISIGVALAIAIVLTGAVLYISSGHFIKTHVLPRVAKSIGCDVQAEKVDFSALSRIEFRNLRIGSEADPLMQAGTIRVRYRALSFLSGQIVVDEVLFDHVRIAATPEKLEALSKSRPPSEKKSDKASKSKKLPGLLVQDVRVNDLNLSYTQDGADPIQLEISNLSLDLPELAGGRNFHLTVAAQAKARIGEQVDAEIKEISLDVDGTLGQNTMPTALILKMDVKGLAGTAGPVLLDDRSVQVAAEVTGGPDDYELQKFSAVEYVGKIQDAALEVKGSLGVNPSFAVLDLMLDIAPDSLLNVIGSLLGNFDFDQTAVAYSGHVEFTSGKRLATRGKLQVRNLTVSAPDIPTLSPVQVSVQHDLAVDLESKAITLSLLDAKVSEGNWDIVTVKLDKALAVDLQNPGSDEKVLIPVGFAVNGLELARLLPFVPPEAGIAKLGGSLSLNGHAVLVGPAHRVTLETTAGIENALFILKDGTALTTPVTPSMELSLDYTPGGMARIERMNAVLRQTGRQEPLLDLEIAGHFDTGMDPSVRNVVDISTRGPVLLDALEKLVVTPEKPAQPTPLPAPETATKTSPPPNLWLGIGIEIDEAIYGNLLLKNMTAKAEYRNATLDLSKAEILVNDGVLTAAGVCDFGTPGKPQYDFKISGRDLQFAPVLATFIPRTALYTKGGMKEIEIAVKGTGFDMASLQDNLVAQVDAELDQLVIERMSGTVGRLTEALLLGMFNMSWSDLSFTDGALDLAIDHARFDDQDMHVQTLLLQAPSFQLDGSGTVQFGGIWAPDMEIKTGFIGAKADSLRRQGYAISTQADSAGYFPGPAIPLKGDLTSLRNQAGLVTEVLVRSGKLSKQDALKADLANQILGSLGGTQTNGEKKKTDVGGILGGILGGVLETQSPQENQTEKNDEAAEAIGNLLQGIFGN